MCVLFLVSSEVTTRRDIRFSAVLPGSGVRLLLKAFPARARQLPARNSTPGRAGQDLSRSVLTRNTTAGGGGGFHLLQPLGLNQACVAGYTVVPPFRAAGKFTDLLVLSDSESCKSWSKKSLPLSTSQSLALKTDLERDHHR